MDNLRKRYTRKVGLQIPDHIIQAMHRHHPTVQILWDRRNKSWAMVMIRGRIVQHVSSISGRLTLANTVHLLNRCHPRNFVSKYARERLLDRMDDSAEARAIEKRSKQMVRDGAGDLFNFFTRRRVAGYGHKR